MSADEAKAVTSYLDLDGPVAAALRKYQCGAAPTLQEVVRFLAN
jgi:hypothetical protein